MILSVINGGASSSSQNETPTDKNTDFRLGLGLATILNGDFALGSWGEHAEARAVDLLCLLC